MFHSEHLQEKWAPLLDYQGLDSIKDSHRRAVTAVLLENQEKFLKEESAFSSGFNLMESPTNSAGTGGFSAGSAAAGPTAGFDPVLISLIRRSMPNLVAYDLAGVQPMTGPTGLIFAMRARYNNQSGNEAFYNEANTVFSGATSAANPYGFQGTLATDTANNFQAGTTTSGIGMPTVNAQYLGATDYGTGANVFQQMAFSIEKVTVTAQSRALKAEYSLELAQDLKAIHGLDAETELSNILSTEILAEINREVIRTIYTCAVPGAQYGTTTAGSFDLDTDSNGRWSVERFKGLIFQIERDANVIAKQTRRGKGNVLIVSSDVASAMAMAGVLQYTPALQADLQVDDTGNTFAGLLHGRIKVYIDPYFGGYTSNQELVTIGYKGTSPYDAGLFYCPYVPLQMVRAVDQFTFQPKIGFKTRYGMVASPFA